MKTSTCFFVFSLTALCTGTAVGAELQVSVSIDGQSRLVIQRDQIYWNHLSQARPLSPTTLNGRAWSPSWPSATATTSTPLPAVVTFGDGITAIPQLGRGTVNVVQLPGAGNNFTLIVDFNDSAFAGADVYNVLLRGVNFAMGGQGEQQVSLVPAGSIWRYKDDGSEQWTFWRELDFDDSGWASGRAQLGYGDGDEVTVVSFGPNANLKYVTTYFRRNFTVANPQDFTSLTVRLLRDDGGVVYVNGFEVFRSNMPFFFIDSQTLAASTIPNSDESVFFQTNLPPEALVSGTNVVAVEIHQASRASSDISFDLELRGSVPTGPPVILRQPRPRFVAPGGTATFSVLAAGGLPLRYQWSLDGMDLDGATNAFLTGSDLMAADQGTLRVTVSNAFGAVTSTGADLTLIELTGDFFQVTGLTTNHAFATGHETVTGDDRGGIAATFNDLFVSGDFSTARFELSDLGEGMAVGRVQDSLVSDLRSGRVYALANGSFPVTLDVVNTLLEVDGATGALTSNAIALSTPINMNGCHGCMGLFSGFGRIALHNGSRAFVILLPSGTVQDLGPMPAPQHRVSENWAYWGVAEYFAGSTWLVYVRDSQTITRTRAPDGLTAPVAVFGELSDMASITVSPLFNRWYFHHQYDSQFRQGAETVGFAEARLAHEQQPQAPAILVSPRDRTVHEGSNITFTVVALGYPLRHQWLFNGQPIAGATNESLTIQGAGAAQVGLYSVVVMNGLGSATSGTALLNVVEGGNGAARVAIYGAENSVWNDDVRQKILGTGLFDRVDAFELLTVGAIPTLEELQEYDSVLVYSDNALPDPLTFENRLADYVDGGGGLVVATFAFSDSGGGPQDRLRAGGYLPFTSGFGNSGGPLTLVPDSGSHVLLDGVTSFNGGTSSYRNSGLGLTAGAELVAHWSNGEPLLAVRPTNGVSVVGLNFFPPSRDARGDLWDTQTSGARLMANALLQAGGGSRTVPFVAPGIRTQPASLTVLQGLDTRLSVAAFGSPELAYQWTLNNLPIPGGTNRTLALTEVQTNQAGGYRVVVTNAFGAVTSQVATLTVLPTRGLAAFYTDYNIGATGLFQPILTAQFTPRRIDDIRTFDFSRANLLVLDESSEQPSPDLRHRLPEIQEWVNRGGRLIVHQRNFNFEALAANPFLTRGILLTNFTFPTPDINVLPPRNTLVTTGPHGMLDDVSLDGGNYYLATYAIGSTLPAGGAAILGGGPNTNQVVAFAYGLGAGLIYYSTVPLDYYLEYDSSFRATMRDVYAPNVIEYAAAYTPSGPPVIFSGPNNVVATVGTPASFFVSTRGQTPLGFQWFFNNSPLAGATNNPLELTSVSNGNAGVYSVQVSNALGMATSPGATLKIVPRYVVGVFDDPQFVNHQAGTAGDISQNLQATLSQLGHDPRPFTNLLAAVTNAVLLFPEIGVTQLTPQLDDASRALLRAWVLQGGLLVVAGGTYFNLDFLNEVYGFSLYTPGSVFGVGFGRTAQAAGTPFSNAPPTLYANQYVYPVYSSTLPPGALSLYDNPNFSASAVAWMPYGSGAILLLGWNWFDAAPLGSQDGGWLDALAVTLQTRGISLPVPFTDVPLVPVGSTWRYLDDGSDQGTAWHDLNFDDSAWAAGPAQLGYGDGDEATVVGFGPDPDNKFITTYFRRAFTLTNVAEVGDLTLRVIRDDGVAVYVNGIDVAHDCLLSGAAYDYPAFCQISGQDENRFVRFTVDPAWLRDGTNVLAVEIHQNVASSPDMSFDLELTALVPPAEPVIRTQPMAHTVPVGSTLVLDVVATGALPLTYQWRLNGQNLPGANQAILILNGITTNQSGAYSVLISNALGQVLSSPAPVRAVPLGQEVFRISALSTNDAVVIDHYSVIGYDRGGIAASGEKLFYTGSDGTGLFDLADLSGGTNLGSFYDALVSDLRTEIAYSLANGTNVLTAEGGVVNRLLELDGATGAWTGRTIPLSQPIELSNPFGRFGDVGLFAGFGRIVAHNGHRAWSIEVPSGTVVELGTFAVPTHLYSSSWAYWGVAEFFDGAIWLVYVQDPQTIMRQRISDGTIQALAQFRSLGDMAAITVSLPFNRWYFHHQYDSQFGGFYQTLGFAGATFDSSAPTIAPVIVKQPADQTVAASGTAVIGAVARGTGPLRYQWMFGNTALPGATNATLRLNQLTTGQSGRYSVAVSNGAGMVHSAEALLTVVPLVGDTFRITSLSTNNVVVVDHDGLTGGARSGLAASAREIFYCGSSGVARFDAADLSGGTALLEPPDDTGAIYDGMISELGSETVFVLGNGTSRIDGVGGVVTTLLGVDGVTGALTGTNVALSEPIDLGDHYGDVGLFAGLGRIVVTEGARLWTIEMPSGRVLSMGPSSPLVHVSSGIGAYWGVAEFFGNAIWLVYVRDTETIVRRRAPDGPVEVVASFENLGDMPAITVSRLFNRWYFHHQNPSQFSPFYQTLGFAEATFESSAPAIAPSIIRPPVHQTVATHGTVDFHVTARGSGPLAYQWLFEGVPIAGATHAVLTLTNAAPAQAGHYSVRVSNAAGVATSAEALLRVVPSVSVAVFDDMTFVNSYDDAFSQSDSVQASLGRLGHQVVPFTNVLLAANGSRPLLFPANEAADLAPALSPAAREALQNFVARGGVIILHGCQTDANRPARFLNTVFGFAVMASYPVQPAARSSQAAGTAFEQGPAVLPLNVICTALLPSSLPAGSRRLYEGPDDTHVAAIPFGSGKILFLGWNWTDAVPLGRQDGGWLTVLGSAIEETAPPVPQAPQILEQPRSRTVVAGTPAQLRVLGTGYPLNYQWLFNGHPLPGATNFVLQFSNVTVGAAGTYAVEISNALGRVTSADAVLSVAPPLFVGVFDNPQYVDTSGGAYAESDNIQASLSQLGHNVRPFSAYPNGVTNQVVIFPYFKFNDPTFSLDAASRAALQAFVQTGGVMIVHGGYPNVNFLNSVFGLPLSYFGYVGGTYYRTPQAGGTRFAEGPATLPGQDRTLAVYAPSVPLIGGRRLYTNGVACVLAQIPYGAGQIVYMGWDWFFAAPAGSQDGGWVEALGNAVLTRIALPAALPQITLQPQDQSVLDGQDATFSVGAVGSAPLVTQWLYNGLPIPAATNGVLLVPQASSMLAGGYQAVVSNDAGSITSRVATLVVRPSRGVAGYVQACCGYDTAPMLNAIRDADFTPMEIQDVSTLDLSQLTLLLLTVDSAVRDQPLVGRLPAIQNWVNDGGRLIVHDWNAATDQGPNPFLPLAAGTVLVRAPSDDIQILPPGDNQVVSGPHGMLNNGSLDNGATSFHGYARRATLPPRALPIFGAGSDTNAVVGFSYALGKGSVYYAGMPLDHHVNTDTATGGNFRLIYVPNLIEHAISFAVGGPPLLLSQPASRGALLGGPAAFAAYANGQGPLSYQWFFNGTALAGATNGSLLLPAVTANQAGGYNVIVSNTLGASTSAVAVLTIIETVPFRILSLSTNSSQIVEHNGITGDDRGGIGASATHVFYTGDNATGRFAITNLANGTTLPELYNALVSDLRTETLYTLADGPFPVSGGGGSATALIQISAAGVLTTNIIPLSDSIPLANDTGIFAGYGAAVLYTAGEVYRIELPSGLVSDLGSLPAFQHYGCENWAFWGVTEYFGGAVYLDYVRDSQTIVRTRVPDGFTTNLATFTSLGDMCSFTVSTPLARWYFHYEGGAQFGGTSETVGYAAASFDRPPRISMALVDRTINEDANTGLLAFGVMDTESPAAQLVTTASSSNPELLPEANILFAGTTQNRTVTLTPAPDQFGTVVVTVTVFDGIGLSTNTSFVLTVLPVNDPPSFLKGPDLSVLEDAGSQSISNWAKAIAAGPLNEAGQTLAFLVTNDNAALFAVPPAISPAGTLTFTPAPDANGSAFVTVRLQDGGGVAHGGQDISPPQSFVIHVTPVNDPPAFARGPDVAVPEDAGPQTIPGWATNVRTGPSDESGQTLAFLVTGNSAPGLFAAPPALLPNGTLQFTAAPNAHGDSLVSIRLQDNGGTTNGGLDLSPAQSFHILIQPVNDRPLAFAQSILATEDSPKLITLTGSDLDGDPLSFSIVTPPAHGTLSGSGPNRTYLPATNYFGPDSFTFNARDGQLDSAEATVSIQVNPVNDPPTFTRGPNQSVVSGSGLLTVPQWATNISPGPAGETAQTLAFQVVADLPSIFTTPPAIASDGTLTFTPAPNTNGVATITVLLRDNGGTDNGGQDTSAPQTFLITILSANLPPVAVLRVSPLVMLTPNATNAVVLSPNNSNAVVRLDGSMSHDPENDPLSFAWFEGTATAPFATGIVASNAFTLGNHSVRLLVSDGALSAGATSLVQVVSVAKAVVSLIDYIQNSALASNRQRPLLASLDAAIASFDRGQFTAGVNQLRAFQNKVRAQVTDPVLSEILIQSAQNLINAARTQPRLLARMAQPGRLEFTLMGESGASYIIQSSTDLIRWSTFTNLVSLTGTNQFIDAAMPGAGRRFYRAIGP